MNFIVNTISVITELRNGIKGLLDKYKECFMTNRIPSCDILNEQENFISTQFTFCNTMFSYVILSTLAKH